MSGRTRRGEEEHEGWMKMFDLDREVGSAAAGIRQERPRTSSVYQEDSGYDPLSDLARVVAQLTERVEVAEREIARLRALHPPTVADVEVSRG